MSSTACWTSDARTPSASPDPQPGLGAARLSHLSLQQRRPRSEGSGCRTTPGRLREQWPERCHKAIYDISIHYLLRKPRYLYLRPWRIAIVRPFPRRQGTHL